MNAKTTVPQAKFADTGSRRGAVLVLVALSLVIIFGMLSFAVDIGRVTLLRSEIQNAVDAGALAAQLKLQEDPKAVAAAAALARQYVRKNRVGSAAKIPEGAIQVEVGRWDATTKTFTATSVDPNAVRVYARQDNELFSFAKVIGHDKFGAPASAIASGTSATLDIMMVLDLSGSMKDDGRIGALQQSAPAFVDAIGGLGGTDQIGVMGLSADPSDTKPYVATCNLYNSGLHPTPDHHVGVLEATLTTDLDSLKRNSLSVGQLTAGKYNGYTGTGASLGDAVHYLINGSEARDKARKIVVLMSDGYANKPTGNGPGYAMTMANYAKSNNVTVYTISLGNGADVELMKNIAAATGGKYFDATGSGVTTLRTKLTDAFLSVVSDIKRTQLVR